MLGLGSMLGTGVFVSLGFGYALAGDALLYVIAVAAFVALCNGLSSAQLAAAHPVSGGTYEYAYYYLNRHWAFVAGVVFVCAKSASAAAALLASASLFFVALGLHAVGFFAVMSLALVLLASLTLLVLAGVKRSNQVNTLLVVLTLLSLGVFVVSLNPLASESVAAGPQTTTVWPDHATFLSAVAIVFVTYTGYGRVATLGEEVLHPRRTIPRAIVLTLMVVMLLYLLVGWVLVQQRPLVTLDSFNLSQLLSSGWQQRVVILGAAVAMLGVALNLLLGVSRVVLAMARRGDLPKRWAKLNAARTAAPYATLLTTVVMAVIVGFGSVKAAWEFSAFTVLVYYGITNLAALRVGATERFIAKFWSGLGLLSCCILAVALSPTVLGLGSAVVLLLWFLRNGWQTRLRR